MYTLVHCSYNDCSHENVDFYVYTESDLKINSKRPIIIDNKKEIPELTKFLEDAANIMGPKPSKKVRKFCHKVYVQCHAFKNLKADHLHWVDADVYAHNLITNNDLEKAIGNNFSTFMGQHFNTNPETGYLGFDCRTPGGLSFINFYQNIYDTHKILELDPPWDPVAYWYAKSKFEDKLKFQSITKGTKHSHVFKRSHWAGLLAHAKGRSKYNNSEQLDSHLKAAIERLISV